MEIQKEVNSHKINLYETNHFHPYFILLFTIFGVFTTETGE